jgi:hypothetical protein
MFHFQMMLQKSCCKWNTALFATVIYMRTQLHVPCLNYSVVPVFFNSINSFLKILMY